MYPMAEASGTSFIPKNANRVRKPRTSKRIYIFSYVSYVFFFGTLLAVIGVYVLSVQTGRALEASKQELARERETFDQGDIAAVRDLEKRIVTAEKLLNESAAPSTLFSSLESIVADPVRFASVAYERLPGNEFTITFDVAADAFDPILFEQELLKTVPALAEAEVVDYRYGQASEETEESAVTAGERVVVTFESRASTGLIPYEPPETAATGTSPIVDDLVATSTDDAGSLDATSDATVGPNE